MQADVYAIAVPCRCLHGLCSMLSVPLFSAPWYCVPSQSACVFQRLWNGFQISSQNRWVASSNSVGVNVVTGFVFLFFCFRLDNRSIMHSCIFAPRLDIMRASCFPIAVKVAMLLRYSQHCCYLQLAVLTNVIFPQCDLHLV